MGDAQVISYLLTPRAVRERCYKILEMGLAERCPHFKVRSGKLPAVADYVAGLTLASYPDLAIPLHSRWTHLDAGGVPRVAELTARLAEAPPDERARALIDLVVTSVLLDAGAGPDWKYHEAETGLTFARSEGLAVASFRMFMAGAF